MGTTSEQVLTPVQRPQIRTARIILPTEHGSWSILLEPLVVGSAIAFSAAAPWIALATVGAFMARQPLKVLYLSRSNPTAASAALRFLLIFASFAVIGITAALLLAGPWALFPFAVAAPLALQQTVFDLSRRSRNLLAEIAGSVAISSSVAALVLAGGLGLPAAAALWAILVCRFIPSILYVRNRLSLEKGKKYERFQPIFAHILAFAIVALFATVGLASWLTAAMFAFLMLRSVHGLSSYRIKMKAMKIGIWEVVYGTLTVITMIAGYHIGF